MDGPVAALTPTAGDLQAGFAAFVEASRRLELRYAELKARAEAIDQELAATNARLQQALLERDAIFAALPLGVVARRGDGTVTFQNGEADRLRAAATAAGVDLLAMASGDVEIGQGGARVRTAELPDGDLLLLEDRSRIRELEREVHRLDRLAGLSELALGVAHEIKNPLNGALGFTELLLRSCDAEPQRRHAERVRRGLLQVDEIVKSLLAFARPEQHAGRAGTIAQAVASAAAAAGLPLAQLTVAGERTLRVEQTALVRALAVLFRNAIEAKGDAAVAVQVQCRRSGARAELVVADDGPGVPAAIGQRVLEPFVSTKDRGTGLGLPLAARVLAFLGGDLALLNPGEPGARFCVRLPLCSEPDAGAIAAAEASA